MRATSRYTESECNSRTLWVAIFHNFKDIQPTGPPSVEATSTVASTVSNLSSQLSSSNPQKCNLPIASNKPDISRLNDPPEQLNKQQSTKSSTPASPKQKRNNNQAHGVKETKQDQQHYLKQQKNQRNEKEENNRSNSFICQREKQTKF